MSPIIYCIEGHWQYDPDDPTAEPSVEPLLQMLCRGRPWNYVRRNAATDGELFYWMKHEWKKCPKGSILYFATHGDEGAISLERGNESPLVSIEELGKRIDCGRRLVHFSACSTLACDEDRVRFFMEKSGAAAVSGYRTDVGWASELWPPAALCDLMLFSEIADQEIDLSDMSDGRKASRRKLLRLRDRLQKRFCDCRFHLCLP